MLREGDVVLVELTVEKTENGGTGITLHNDRRHLIEVHFTKIKKCVSGTIDVDDYVIYDNKKWKVIHIDKKERMYFLKRDGVTGAEYTSQYMSSLEKAI